MCEYTMSLTSRAVILLRKAWASERHQRFEKVSEVVMTSLGSFSHGGDYSEAVKTCLYRVS
jgi:hypothetical protein